MQKMKVASLIMVVLLIGLSYYCLYLVAELNKTQNSVNELNNTNNELGTENSDLRVELVAELNKNSHWQDLYQDSLRVNSQLSETIREDWNTIGNMSNTIFQLNNVIRDLNASDWARTYWSQWVEILFLNIENAKLRDSVNELNATLMSLQEENAQFYEQELTNLTIYVSTDYNATANEKLSVYNMSLTVGEPFLFTRPINGTLDITQNTTLIGSFLVPHLEGTKATFNLTFFLSFPSENSTNQTNVVVSVGFGGPSTYEVLLDKPFITLFARIP